MLLDVASPPARRIRQASWADPRLAIGVLLILVSVVVGAKVVGAADRTQPMHSLKRDLPAGHVLSADDVEPVSARIVSARPPYIPAKEAVAGQVLLREVRSGELLARSAVGANPGRPTREVSVAVKLEHVAAGLTAGSRVDVVATTPKSNDVRSRTWTVAKGLEVKGQPKSEGGLGANTFRVVLDVPAELVLDVTAAMRTAEIDIVEVPPGDQGDIGDVAGAKAS